MRVLWLLPLIGCQIEQGVDPVDPVGDDFEPSPYVVPDDADDAPTYDRTFVEKALDEGIQAIIAINAKPALDGYRVAMTWSDASCPTWYTDGDGNSYWYAYCYASAGGTYSGYGYHYQSVAVTDENGTWDSETVYLSATIDGPGGKRFGGAGSAQVTTGYATDGAWVSQSYLDGTFEWSDAESGSWLADGLSPQIGLYQNTYPDGASAYTYANGAITGSSAVSATIAFAENGIYQNIYWDGDCDIEPSGVISVRDDSGYWYDVYFDSIYDGTMDMAACDGCGAVWLRGELVGEACADFSPWLALPYGGTP